MPKISVVMSVYNGEKYVHDSVESIIHQSERDIEFIIINDGSTDKSLEILREFQKKDTRIRLISRENRGLISSLNEGVSVAKGEYIARMDVDDISHEKRLKEQYDYMKENDLAVCGTWAKGINNKGDIVADMNYCPATKEIKFFTLLHNPFIHSTVMFKREVFEYVGGYNSFFKHVEDYELWTRLIFKYKTGNLQKYLLSYRLHDEQITRKYRTSMVTRAVLVRVFAVFRFLFRW
jgi:glycosyltransferase involved in cell wall biosynthesis